MSQGGGMSKKVGLKTFTKPEFLSKFQKEYLIEFLNRFDGFLNNHNINPEIEGNLIQAVGNAIHKSVNSENGLERASDIINALQDITEMSNHHAYFKFISEAKTKKLTLPKGLEDSQLSVENCALYFWLHYKDFFIDIYAKNRIKNYQSFLYFVGAENKEREFPLINDDIIKDCQQALNPWLIDNGQVENPTIYHFIHGDRLTIIIKYGMPLVRDTSIDKDGKENGIFFNPPQSDILIYHRKYDEISLNTPNIKEQDATYLSIIGEHIFGNKSYFQNKKEFSLQPLADLTIEKNFVSATIKKTRLIEITYDYGYEREIRQSSHLMPTLVKKNKKDTNAKPYQIISAKFNLTLNTKGNPKRVVTILNGNKAKMDRSDDGLLIEDWIREHGFLKTVDNKKGVIFWDKVMSLNMHNTSRAYLLHSFTEEEVEQYFVASETEIDEYPCDNRQSGCSRERRAIADGDIFVCKQTSQECKTLSEYDYRDLLMCEINFQALADKIREEWSNSIISSDYKVISEDKNLYRIGFYTPKGDISFPVYFHIPFYDGAYQEALEMLLSEDDGYIFLMPSIDYVSHETLEDKKRNKKSIIVGLNRYTAEAKFKDFNELHEKELNPISINFPTPPGVEWGSITIKFIDGHTVSISCKVNNTDKITNIYNYTQMGMNNKKDGNYKQSWAFLQILAEERGAITWDSPKAGKNIKKDKQALKDTLQAFFCITQTEPIIEFKDNKGRSAYKALFNIYPESES